MQFELTRLFTGLPVILSPMPGTPRLSLVVSMRGGVIREPAPGMAKMASRLLLKGTERRDAETLARELDERGIDLHEILLTECLLLQAVFLNRDLPAVLDLLEDVLLHSTFIDFTKEAMKMRGEIAASLDLPAEIAQDLLARTLFPDHPYGHTGTRILESLGSFSEAQTKEWYSAGLAPAAMNITLVGDFHPDEVVCQLDDAFCELTAQTSEVPLPPFTPLSESQVVTRARPDAQQAQVYQGWYAPPLGSEMQAALLVMNSLLGGGGLSSASVHRAARQAGAGLFRAQPVPAHAPGGRVRRLYRHFAGEYRPRSRRVHRADHPLTAGADHPRRAAARQGPRTRHLHPRPRNQQPAQSGPGHQPHLRPGGGLQRTSAAAHHGRHRRRRASGGATAHAALGDGDSWRGRMRCRRNESTAS